MRAQLADGRILEFPDGTDPAVVRRVVKQLISQDQRVREIPTEENLAASSSQAAGERAREESSRPWYAPIVGAIEAPVGLGIGMLGEASGLAMGLGTRIANPNDPNAFEAGVKRGREPYQKTLETMTPTGKEYMSAISEWTGEHVPALIGVEGEIAGSSAAVGKATEAADIGTASERGKVGGAAAYPFRKVREAYRAFRGKEAVEAAEKLKTETRGVIKDEITQLQEESEKLIYGQGEGVQTAKEAEAKRQRILSSVERIQKMEEPKDAAALSAVSPRSQPAEVAGGIIHNQAIRNVSGIENTRTKLAITMEKNPAFSASDAREAAGDLPATNATSKVSFQSLVDQINLEISRTPPSGRKPLVDLLKDLGARKTLSGYTIAGSKANLRQFEYLRRELRDPSLRENRGFKAMTAARAKELADMVEVVMRDYEPRVGTYIDKYRELSKQIEETVGGTLGEAAMEQVGRTAVMAQKPSQLARKFLDGTSDSAARLIKLVGGRNPDLDAAVSGYVRSNIEGMSSKQIGKYIEANRGMLDSFELTPKVTAVANTRARMDRLSEVREAAGKGFEKAAKERAAAEQKSVEQAAKLQKQQSGLDTFLLELEHMDMDDAIAGIRRVMKDLYDNGQGRMSREQYTQFLMDISTIKAKYRTHQQAVAHIRQLVYFGASVTLGSTLGAHYAAKSIQGTQVPPLVR